MTYDTLDRLNNLLESSEYMELEDVSDEIINYFYDLDYGDGPGEEYVEEEEDFEDEEVFEDEEDEEVFEDEEDEEEYVEFKIRIYCNNVVKKKKKKKM